MDSKGTGVLMMMGKRLMLTGTKDKPEKKKVLS